MFKKCNRFIFCFDYSIVVLARCLVGVGSSKNLSSYKIKVKYINTILSISNIFLYFLKNTQIKYRFFAPDYKSSLRGGGTMTKQSHNSLT
jgi:hypothetical protein